MRFLCDTHTHTIFSRHAYSTIEENVRAASEAGLELLASTDHFSAMANPRVEFAGDPDLRDYQFFINQEVWPRSTVTPCHARGPTSWVIKNW